METSNQSCVQSPPVTERGAFLDRLSVSGRLVRIVRPKSETYDPVEDPAEFLHSVRESGVRADILRFSQRVSRTEPCLQCPFELEAVAILEIDTYERWWKDTVNCKTRNMVRKAEKKGVQIGVVEYTDELVHGIKTIYDESPIRQGKKSRHFGKTFDRIKQEHGTFLERSEFIAANVDDRLVGFAKVVYQPDFASIMNFIALIAEKNRAPSNALLAKVVERCADRGVGLLHYGFWSRRGFGDFKKHHGFVSRDIPCYYIPLTRKGELALRWGLHRPVKTRIPDKYIDRLAAARMRWYAARYPLKRS